MEKITFLMLVVLISSYSLAQSSDYNEQKHSIETIVDAFNKQDYKLMQKPWGIIGKLIISNKMLRRDFEPYFKRYGTATIDTTIFSSIYNGTTELKFNTSPNNRAFLTFNFNEKGKVEGMGFGYPTFVYRKRTSTEESFLLNTDKNKSIDSIVARYITNPSNNFNGCIMVTNGDDIIYKNCIGYSNFDKQITLNDSSKFLLASCTKQFTAIAIMQLQEQGKLNYDDNIKLYLPDFPYDTITIRNLLTHTSGLPDYFSLLEKYWDKTKIATNNDVYSLLKEKKPKMQFSPNEYFRYSNTGYVILSLIIEKISGKTYNEFLVNNIFKPLKMNQTFVYHRRKQIEKLENYALGYVFSKDMGRYILPDSLEKYNYVTYMDGITGDDGVSSSIIDLKIWNEALKKNSLVSQNSMDLANTKHKLNNGKEVNYGFGVFLIKGQTIENVAYHTGGWPGYTTMILRFSDRNESIIILSNNSYDNFAFLVDEICAFILN